MTQIVNWMGKLTLPMTKEEPVTRLREAAFATRKAALLGTVSLTALMR